MAVTGSMSRKMPRASGQDFNAERWNSPARWTAIVWVKVP
jgi:hypothetical protein